MVRQEDAGSLVKRISVGIDLSLTNTGIAIWREGDGVSLHSIKSSGHKEDTLRQRYQRLGGVTDEVMSSVMPLTGKVSVCIEAPIFSAKGGHAHDRSGLWWSVVTSLLEEYPLTEIRPQELKIFATGKGNASKGAVVDAVARRWSHVETGGDDNLADALVLAALGAAWREFSDTVDLPQTHIRVLDTIKWSWPRVL